MGIAAMLMTLAILIRARAAISEGPNYTNAAVAEQHRIAQFNQAEQSYQDKLKVGLARYNQKQIVRAKVIAAMSSELQARQQTIVIQPAATPYGTSDEPVGRSPPSLTVAALVVSIIGIGLYVNRQRAQEASGQDQYPILDPPPRAVASPKVDEKVVATSKADEIFFCESSGANGRGQYMQEGFLVLKGSIGRKENAGKSTERLQVLFDSGVIREEGNAVIFEKDHLFHSPSMAAIALTGRKANGWLEWKTKDGTTLDTATRQ
jgi:hypothetical protein